MTLEVPSRYLSCPQCGSHEFRVSMTTGGYPAQVTLRCLECSCNDERFWASEDWRDLASLGTFEAPSPSLSPSPSPSPPPEAGLVLEKRRRGKL